jgi:hypothetical protein
MRQELESFWNRLDRKVEHEGLQLKDFFGTGSLGETWLGRAILYRQVAEQLDIVNWYYKNKHTEYSTHYCRNLDNAAAVQAPAAAGQAAPAAALQEYHSQPEVNADGLPVIPGDRGRDPAFGEYEEWLVKGSRSRPDRFRLIQEWEARTLLWDSTTKRYTPANLNQANQSKPQSTLKLAWYLKETLGEGQTGTKFQAWQTPLADVESAVGAIV